MHPGLSKLHSYPFEKLALLKQKADVPTGKTAIDLSIGEPKHETPPFILDALVDNLNTSNVYPVTRGSDELRNAISNWLVRRFRLPETSINADKHILPVNGTREAIFAFAQFAVDQTQKNPAVLFPNPFYQIYEGAAILAGAEPVYVNCGSDKKFLPDFDSITPDIWKRCQLLYLCSPGNPTGAVMDQSLLIELLDLADKYDFIIAADECYSELYFDEDHPPVGLLQAATESGREEYTRCVVFHSLSKRSNMPGIRSGFIAGDANLLSQFLRYRTYHGCAMPLFIQSASIAAWQDEAHVRLNRSLYREKFSRVLEILAPVMEVSRPQGGFYLWPKTPVPDTDFALGLFSSQNITVLPGSFISRIANNTNPGQYRLRIALVPPLTECVTAAERICEYIKTV